MARVRFQEPISSGGQGLSEIWTEAASWHMVGSVRICANRRLFWGEVRRLFLVLSLEDGTRTLQMSSFSRGKRRSNSNRALILNDLALDSMFD